jgi:hypothetical protein
MWKNAGIKIEKECTKTKERTYRRKEKKYIRHKLEHEVQKGRKEEQIRKRKTNTEME